MKLLVDRVEPVDCVLVHSVLLFKRIEQSARLRNAPRGTFVPVVGFHRGGAGSKEEPHACVEVDNELRVGTERFEPRDHRMGAAFDDTKSNFERSP